MDVEEVDEGAGRIRGDKRGGGCREGGDKLLGGLEIVSSVDFLTEVAGIGGGGGLVVFPWLGGLFKGELKKVAAIS